MLLLKCKCENNVTHSEIHSVVSFSPYSVFVLIFVQAKMDGKMDTTPAAAATGMKPTAGIPIAPQPTKIATPPLTGIGTS